MPKELEVSGVTIPRIRIPKEKTGRNISVVIGAAAMNYRAKKWALMRRVYLKRRSKSNRSKLKYD